MNAAIARLTDAQRYVLLHRTVDDESRATIAATLGISPAKVRTLGEQALHEVRKYLQLGGWLRPFPTA
jgi:DNA-directed RNA polymerase specialized sigma24 family protein